MTVTLYVGDEIVMVDRYAGRRQCVCPKPELSSFNGMRGKVVQTKPCLMVLLDGERLPMRFDERDLDRVDGVE